MKVDDIIVVDKKRPETGYDVAGEELLLLLERAFPPRRRYSGEYSTTENRGYGWYDDDSSYRSAVQYCYLALSPFSDRATLEKMEEYLLGLKVSPQRIRGVLEKLLTPPRKTPAPPPNAPSRGVEHDDHQDM